MKTRVETILGRTNSLVGYHINERQKRVCRSFNFSFLQKTFPTISTVDGTGSYSLPTGFKDDLHVYYVDSDGQKYELDQIDLVTAWEKYGTTSTDKGEPEAWSLEATTFSIWPIPDAVYTIGIEGFGYLADLSLDADHNELTDNWPELLISGAVADCYLDVGMLEESSFWEGKFQTLLRDLRSVDVERQLPGVMILEPRTGPKR